MKNSNFKSVLDQTYRKKIRKCYDVISGTVYLFYLDSFVHTTYNNTSTVRQHTGADVRLNCEITNTVLTKPKVLWEKDGEPVQKQKLQVIEPILPLIYVLLSGFSTGSNTC